MGNHVYYLHQSSGTSSCYNWAWIFKKVLIYMSSFTNFDGILGLKLCCHVRQSRFNILQILDEVWYENVWSQLVELKKHVQMLFNEYVKLVDSTTSSRAQPNHNLPLLSLYRDWTCCCCYLSQLFEAHLFSQAFAIETFIYKDLSFLVIDSLYLPPERTYIKTL